MLRGGVSTYDVSREHSKWWCYENILGYISLGDISRWRTPVEKKYKQRFLWFRVVASECIGIYLNTSKSVGICLWLTTLIIGKLADLTDAKTKQNTLFLLLINAKCLVFFPYFPILFRFWKTTSWKEGYINGVKF